MGTLKITGYIRGEPLNVNRLIHIPGWGDFQLECVEKLADPRPLTKPSRVVSDIDMTEIPKLIPSEAGEGHKKRVMKVPKGTSEYQAAWILDEGIEEENEDMSEDVLELGEEDHGEDDDVDDAKHVTF